MAIPGVRAKRIIVIFGSLAVASSAIFGAGGAAAQVSPLSAVQVPRPPNLAEFVRDEAAAKVLGKALFWDMQVGSDGVQACATCVGADPRKKRLSITIFLRTSAVRLYEWPLRQGRALSVAARGASLCPPMWLAA